MIRPGVATTIALVVCALAAPAAAAAQDFGFKAGANSATLTITPPNSLISIGPRIGFTGGIYGTRQLSSFLGLETEVRFASKGAKSKTATGSSFSFNYLVVPILARLKISGNSPVRVHLVGGPELGYRINANLVNGSDSVLYNDFVKIYDLGGSVGGDAEFGRIIVDIRYTRGLVDISRNNPDQKVKTKAVTAMFGFALKSS